MGFNKPIARLKERLIHTTGEMEGNALLPRRMLAFTRGGMILAALLLVLSLLTQRYILAITFFISLLMLSMFALACRSVAKDLADPDE